LGQRLVIDADQRGHVLHRRGMQGIEQLTQRGSDRAAVGRPLPQGQVQQRPARELAVGQTALLGGREARFRDGQQRDGRDSGEQASLTVDAGGPGRRIGLLAAAHDQLTVDLVGEVVGTLADRHDRVDPTAGQVGDHHAAEGCDAVAALASHATSLAVAS
jgi:hypothetical protein